jgi:hypothetical protein
MLAHGITGFRQMSGSDALLRARENGTLAIDGCMPGLLELPGDVLSPGNGATVEQAVGAEQARGHSEARSYSEARAPRPISVLPDSGQTIVPRRR